MKFAVGIDVGGTNLRLGVVNSAGEILVSFKERTPLDSPQNLIQSLRGMINLAQEQISVEFTGLGIGWPGTVDPKNGIILETPNIPHFENYPLIANLEKSLGLKCRLDNDAKCAGLAEKYFGAARDLNDFILLTFGTGIGGVLFAHGQLLRGRSGLAGEVGHFCLHPQGLSCGCGGRGCFEKYCSAKALEERAQALGYPMSAREIIQCNDIWAKGLIRSYVDDLALAIGSLTNIFDPEAFVFSGGLFTTGGGPILSELQTRLKEQGFQKMKSGLKFVVSDLEGKAGTIGAACLILS